MTKSINLLVGSKNPAKIAAAKDALQLYFPDSTIECQDIDAPSKVAEQPMTDAETKLGAINRARFCEQYAKDHQLMVDFIISMEGGVDKFDNGCATFAYMAIIHQGQMSIGRSAQLPLPSHVYQALEDGEELGHVMDRLFNTDNIKQKGGAIGLLTHGIATRSSIYTQAIVLAMAPFENPQFFLAP